MATGVYWIGQDGNVWVKDAVRGVRIDNNAINGAKLRNIGSTADGYGGTGRYQMIADPNAPAPAPAPGPAPGPAPSGPSGPSAPAVPQYEDTTAARNLTQANLEALDPAMNAQIGDIGNRYNDILKRYADEERFNKGQYDTQLGSIDSTRNRNHQLALSAAAEGSRGLMATLASMNALGGTGRVLANRMVARTANDDIGESKRTADKNTTQVNTAYESTRMDEENRRREANAARENEIKRTRGDFAAQRQSYQKDMADLFRRAGMFDQSNQAMAIAQSQIGDIHAGNRVQSAGYTPRKAAFNPGDLANYLAGQNDMTVSTSGGALASGPAINSPLIANQRRREEEV